MGDTLALQTINESALKSSLSPNFQPKHPPLRLSRFENALALNAGAGSYLSPSMQFTRWLIPLTLAASVAVGAETPSIEGAMALMRKGDPTNAIATLGSLLKDKPDEVRAWHLRAQMRGLIGDADGAIADFGEAIRREPKSPYLVQERGMLHFRRNDIDKALIDFDRANELEPRMRPQNWQRGIALYYAGRFADGRRQFESHQTVNTDDVENAAWHFLCTAREKNLETARARLIPIEGDTRVPMREVHRLFAGTATPADVMKAAQETPAEPRGRQKHLFYARLYLGLYFEATGDKTRAAEHIRAAADMAPRDDYMGDVARVHARRLKE
jgi:lipoprotein NlpI